MMTKLKVTFLGPPLCHRGDEQVAIRRKKGMAMLAYLSVTSQPQSRESVATLLWPDLSHADALKSLRRDLARLRQDVGQETISADRQTVAFDSGGAWVDVVQFEANLGQVNSHGHFPDEPCGTCLEALRTAVSLYTDEFMAGFNLPDCPEFDDWQYFKREALRAGLSGALQKLMQWCEDQHELEKAIVYGRRWLALDPMNELTHRELMRLYTLSGQQSAAIRQYQSCVQVLEEELGIEPEEETTALFEAIRDRQSGEAIISNNLPFESTPFVGRQKELGQIEALLREPGSRLITLLGQGGSGKTRLAIEAARRALFRHEKDPTYTLFAKGIFFVSLAPLAEPESIIQTIAEQISFSLQNDESPKTQLLNYLRQRKMLLVLDNFEHLVAQSELVHEIIQTAPGVSLIITSRQKLNLSSESIIAIGGLGLPAVDETPEMRIHSALELFLNSARRSLADFEIDEGNLSAVLDICQLVEGLPLGIVLAAAWVDVLTLSEIATEIQEDIDFLSTEMSDVPARHRSMRTAFNYSWRLLEAEERQILARLSVFRGGFTREAARQVTGATLPQLVALSNKSLLTRDLVSGRYQIHELIRQLAAEKLKELSQTAEISERHADYFLELALTAEPGLTDGAMAQWLNLLDAEYYNLRTAQGFLIGDEESSGSDNEKGMILCRALWVWDFTRGQFRQGRMWSLRALTAPGVDKGSLAYGQAAYVQASFAFFQGDLESAEKWTAVSLELCKKHQDLRGELMSYHHQGLIMESRNKLDEAEVKFTQSLALLDEDGKGKDLWAKSVLFNDLSSLYFLKGDFEKSLTFVHKRIEIFRESKNEFGGIYSLINLSNIYLKLGNIEEAEKYALECRALAQEIGDPRIIAITINLLGEIATARGEFNKASQLMAQALTKFNDIGNLLSVFELLYLIAANALRGGLELEAAQLLGATDAIVDQFDISRPFDPQTELHAELIQTLPTDDLREALDKGSKMSLDETINFASTVCVF